MPITDFWSYGRAVDVLDREYKLCDWAANPAKLSLPIRTDPDGKLASYFNVMTAKLSTGHFGGKYIYVDDPIGGTNGRTFVYSAAGNMLLDLDASELTRLRCALMAIMAVRRFYGAHIFSELRFGFIGAGQINAITAQILHHTYGVPGHWMTVKASPRNPYKSAKNFPDYVQFTTDAKNLAGKSAVFVCTNLRNREEVYEIGDLTDYGQLPPLLITQDGGWTLGASWRGYSRFSYTDHVEQILAHANPGDDYDFPWDAVPPRVFNNLNHGSFRRGRPSDDLPAIVYLSGMALTDIAIALMTNGHEL